MTVYAPLDALRLHVPADVTPRKHGEFVLYWMQTTLRAQDNFALNHAIAQADALGVPVLVYHGLRHDYPWANDRLHTFVLESVVDLYAGFGEKGIQYAFYLDNRLPEAIAHDRARHSKKEPSRSPLLQLAERAALVVTDFFPTFMVPRQLERLRQKTSTPIVAVDSCTVVPMDFHRKEHLSARGIRPVLLAALPEYLWPVKNPVPKFHTPVALPFNPVQPTPANIRSLVASCAIDHTVPPARHIRGGTTAARARLQRFLKLGLHRYAEERSDPNQPDASSGMSPYLHFGNIAIHEVLLNARAVGPAGQYEKFQDEALTWREVSHNFAYFNNHHRTVDGIPGWAREQLTQHEADPPPRPL